MSSAALSVNAQHAHKKNILMVFGTRPEAIKMAPVVRALQERQEVSTTVCVTGQHRQMLDQVLSLFEITPAIDLNIMQANQDLADITSRVLLGIRDTLRDLKPDAILVHGDTTTALSAAMAGFYAGIPVGHVEAGLRTHNVHSPFPEEFNRQVISKVARWHFAPTQSSQANLLAEGTEPNAIYVTGNTVIDALLWTLKRLEDDGALGHQDQQRLNQLLPFNWREQRFILMTGHRRENFGSGFIQICDAAQALAKQYPDVPIVYPVHLNPNVREPVLSRLEGLPNVHLLEPLQYEPFSLLLKHCYFVLTDSGGIQEEAPSLGKPVLVMRETTERPEAVEAGTVELVSTDTRQILASCIRLLEDPDHYKKMSEAHNPYGDGHAAQRIADIIVQWSVSA
jgi:UDP-N-acetylglucosamine 2-epimerase (non-hydrolysing)